MDEKTPLSAWPVPEATPRTIRSLGRWPRSTHLGVGMWLAGLVTLGAMAASVIVFARSFHPAALFCPALAGLAALVLLGAIALDRRNNRRLLTEGRAALAHVDRTPGSVPGFLIVNYTFETHQQQLIRGQTTAPFEPSKGIGGYGKLEPKTPLVLIYDWRKPARQVVPGFYGIEFQEVFDKRPHDMSPRPVDGGALSGAKQVAVNPGALAIDSEGISQTFEGRTRRVAWGKPFSVQLSAWLLDSDTARLHVTLRSQGAPVSALPVSFSVDLPQAAISARVPIKQEALPRISTQSFEGVWASVRWYGALHGMVFGDLDLARRDAIPTPTIRGARRANNGLPLVMAVFQIALVGAMWFSFDYMDPIRDGERGCASADPRACATLARHYEKGTFRVSPDPDKAFEFYDKACQLGRTKTCMTIGWRFYGGKAVEQDDTRALRFFEAACNEDHPKGCLQEGWMVERGRGADKNARRAARAYDKACEGEEMMACHNLGVMTARGVLGNKDDKEAVRLYALACEGGNMRACTNHGWHMERGRGTPVDLAGALSLYKLACDGGNAQGCANLGWLHQNEALGKVDLEEAVRWTQKACDMDNATGCANLGWLFQEGRGVEQGDATALRLFEKGCELGLDRSCVNLGWLHEHGRGTETDADRAVELYARACDRGHPRGCSNLGWLYDKGTGVKQDKQRAVSLYKLGCDGDISYGCNNLGALVEHGHGVSKDVDRARALYIKACELGSGMGCSNLGLFHKKGLSVAQDDARAVELFEQSCRLGNAKGCGQQGDMLIEGRGVDKDEALGQELRADACERGKTRYCEDPELKAVTPR